MLSSLLSAAELERLLRHLGTSPRPLQLHRGDKATQLDAWLHKAALLQLSLTQLP